VTAKDTVAEDNIIRKLLCNRQSHTLFFRNVGKHAYPTTRTTPRQAPAIGLGASTIQQRRNRHGTFEEHAHRHWSARRVHAGARAQHACRCPPPKRPSEGEGELVMRKREGATECSG
jgi:hypothetical protein